jgi:hypothetical protein
MTVNNDWLISNKTTMTYFKVENIAKNHKTLRQ